MKDTSCFLFWRRSLLPGRAIVGVDFEGGVEYGAYPVGFLLAEAWTHPEVVGAGLKARHHCKRSTKLAHQGLNQRKCVQEVSQEK